MDDRAIAIGVAIVLALGASSIIAKDQPAAAILGTAKAILESSGEKAQGTERKSTLSPVIQSKIVGWSDGDIGNLARVLFTFTGSVNHNEERAAYMGCLFCLDMLSKRKDKPSEGELRRLLQDFRMSAAMSVEVRDALERSRHEAQRTERK